MAENKTGKGFTKYGYWFRHDADASEDDKLRIVRAHYGPEGYAWYFMLLELLTPKSDHKFNIDEEHAHIAVCDQLWTPHTRKDDVYKFIDFAISIRLFSKDDTGHLYSEKHLERMAKIDSIIEKRREAGRAGGYEKSKRFKQKIKKEESTDAPSAANSSLDKSAFTTSELESISAFDEWLNTNAPRVKQMKEPFTPAQVLKLGKDYSRHWDRVKDVLTSMENKSTLLTNYQSANLTCRKWLRNQDILPVSKK